MRINERHLNGVPGLELEGTLTCPLSDSLVDAVRRVATEGPPRLVIHLGGVPSIDAAGLGALVSAFRVVTSYGGMLRLAQVPNRVQTLLDLCRLSSVFGIFDSVEAAVGAGLNTALDSHASDFRASPSRSSLDAIHDWREPPSRRSATPFG